MVTLTREYIMSQRTERGGFTAAQLRALGLSYNQPTGWIDRLCGKVITDEQAAEFERGRTIFHAKTLRMHNRNAMPEQEQLTLHGVEQTLEQKRNAIIDNLLQLEYKRTQLKRQLEACNAAIAGSNNSTFHS